MKLKILSAGLLTVLLLLSLCACGGSPSSTPTASPQATSTPAHDTTPEPGTESDGEDTTPAAEGEYDLDYESEEWQTMSSDRSPLETLKTALATVKPMQWNEVTYEEVAELFGCDASQFKMENGKRVYRWRSSESEYSYCAVLFEETDGEWFYAGGTSESF